MATFCTLTGDRVFLEGGKIKGKASMKLDVQTGKLMIIFLVYLISFSRVGKMKVHR